MGGYHPAGFLQDPEKVMGIVVKRGLFGDRILNANESNKKLCNALNSLEARINSLEKILGKMEDKV